MRRWGASFWAVVCANHCEKDSYDVNSSAEAWCEHPPVRPAKRAGRMMNHTPYYQARYSDKTVRGVIAVGMAVLLLGGVTAMMNAQAHTSHSSAAALIARDEDWYTYRPIAPPAEEVRSLPIWPVRGEVTDEFGTLELFRRRLSLGRHSGIDIAARSGEPVVAFKAGTVTDTVTSGAGGCGLSVTVDHGDDLSSVYCHLSSVAVAVGKVVGPADVIGRVGSTGVSTGPHLHFEIRKAGKPVNPRLYVAGTPTQ